MLRVVRCTSATPSENYLLARLPSGPHEDKDLPARTMLWRSFAAYRKRLEGKTTWIESRIDAALARREELAPNEELPVLAQVASSAGLPIEIIASLADQIDNGKFEGDTEACIKALFWWLEQNPGYVFQVLRPNDVEGLFGKKYKERPSSIEQARHALPVMQILLRKWMAGAPLNQLELANGTSKDKLGTCEVARHFAVRLAADMAFVAGLPARIVAARKIADITLLMPTVLATLGGAVRRGCESPGILANAVDLGRDVSRVAERQHFARISPHIPIGDPAEPFETTLERVRTARLISIFDKL